MTAVSEMGDGGAPLNDGPLPPGLGFLSLFLGPLLPLVGAGNGDDFKLFFSCLTGRFPFAVTEVGIDRTRKELVTGRSIATDGDVAVSDPNCSR